MTASSYKFTSESVSEGHPDKLADQISDAIVDEAYRLAGNDAPAVRCACETLVKSELLVVAGEIRNPGPPPDYEKIARQVVADVGYGDPSHGFDPEACVFVKDVTEQSQDIAGGVDSKEAGSDEAAGAGDQGLMFGYACDETPELMPLPITLAHRLMRRQAQLRRNGHDWLRPDAKSQVTVRYENGRPVEVTDVVLSTQHAEQIDGKPYQEVLDRMVEGEIIEPELALLENIGHNACKPFIINPSGRFVKGGPEADAGLTGRKIIVDTYGGSAPHGGGAFSGKDPSKVDRSASYAARYVAKNIVAAGWASRCLVQLSYAIGKPEPVSLMVDTCGTGAHDDEAIEARVREAYDLSPHGIITMFDLCRPIYQQTAAYGHFGRADIDLPWEDTSQAAEVFPPR